MSPKLQEIAVTLHRDGQKTPWGIRLVGGSDLDAPLVITKVQLGSPAQGELYRGDTITKIGDYDSRDLRHDDAQMLFRNAGNNIHVVVRRDNKMMYNQNLQNGGGAYSNSPASTLSPVSYNSQPHRAPSPLPPGPGSYRAAINSPVATLPHTVFPHINESGAYVPAFRPASRNSGCFSPMPTRDHQTEYDEEAAAILSQPYRTTPLILPGAKVKKDTMQTESYLRHHPNPGMRAHPHHEYFDHDTLMKQRVADSVLTRVVGDEAKAGKVVHKQFNSPIGLYSDQNIENTIKQTVPYKKTVVYDPSKSETYRAIQEDNFGDYVQEVPHPVQHKVYSPNRLIPGKKPGAYHGPPPPHFHNVNALGEANDCIHQSGSFKRLMYSVMGETTY